jgi:hypothetical protein
MIADFYSVHHHLSLGPFSQRIAAEWKYKSERINLPSAFQLIINWSIIAQSHARTGLQRIARALPDKISSLAVLRDIGQFGFASRGHCECRTQINPPGQLAFANNELGDLLATKVAVTLPRWAENIEVLVAYLGLTLRCENAWIAA